MSEVVLSSIEGKILAGKNEKFRTLGTWFIFLNFATVAVVCLIFIKLYRGLSLVCSWLFPSRKNLKNPTILVIGPENDIIRSVIYQLSRRFRSELVNLQEINWKEPSNGSTVKRSTLLYSHAPVGSHGEIKEVSSYVEKTYEKIDILLIAQNERRIDRNSTQTFLHNLNRELLQQFWIVMAFLPGMLRRNSGHIVSIELGGSSLINTGVIRTIHEDLLQSNTNVKLTLMERNTFLENFLPTLSTDLWARLIVESMWNSTSIVRIPSLSSYLFLLPMTLISLLMKSMLKISNVNLT